MSKGLEEIKTLRGFNQVELNNDKNINKSLDIIEKELKALEIIKDKCLPISEIRMIKDSKDYDEYCIKWSWIGKTTNISIQKNKEEFNILKEVL